MKLIKALICVIKIILFFKNVKTSTEIGDYPVIGVEEWCGFRHISTKYSVRFPETCFKHIFKDKVIDAWPESDSNDKIERSPEGNIVADYGEAPWAVNMVVGNHLKDSGVCEGVILNLRWILTSAKCLGGKTIIKVFAGHIKRFNGQMVSVGQVFIHENFRIDAKDSTPLNNIALLKLSSDITMKLDGYHFLSNSICLPVKNWTNVGEETAVYYSFGALTAIPWTNNDVLRRHVLKVSKSGTCEHTCILEDKFKIERGDFGGGLIQILDNGRAVLIGIASYRGRVFGQTDQWYSLFEPISYYIDWILDTIENN